MKAIDPRAAARGAVAARADRPATALVHDAPDARIVVFRIRDGQEVPPHSSASTVLLLVVEGTGVLSGGAGEERVCSAGDLVAYEPEELHGMRAVGGDFVVLATIAPRPGSR